MKPTRLPKAHVHTFNGMVDSAIDSFVAGVANHRANLATAGAVAAIVGALAIVGYVDQQTEVAVANEARRAAEDREAAIAQWHLDRNVRVTIEGNPERVQTIAGQIASLPLLSSPVGGGK